MHRMHRKDRKIQFNIRGLGFTYHQMCRVSFESSDSTSILVAESRPIDSSTQNREAKNYQGDSKRKRESVLGFADSSNSQNAGFAIGHRSAQ